MLTVRSHTLVGLLAWWWTTDLHPSSSTTCKITLLHATQKGTKTIPRSFPLLWARRKRYLAIDGKWILIPSNNKKESATNGKAAASRRALCVYLVLDTSCPRAVMPFVTWEKPGIGEAGDRAVLFGACSVWVVVLHHHDSRDHLCLSFTLFSVCRLVRSALMPSPWHDIWASFIDRVWVYSVPCALASC